jgi:hypothetical protein
VGLDRGVAVGDPELIGLAEAGDEPVDWPPQLMRLNPPIASMKAAATSLFTPPW